MVWVDIAIWTIRRQGWRVNAKKSNLVDFIHTQTHSQFETHAVVNFVILQCDVILVNSIPLLDFELFGARTKLRCSQLFQIPDRIIFVALNSHFLSQAIVQDHFNHTFFVRKQIVLDCGWHKPDDQTLSTRVRSYRYTDCNADARFLQKVFRVLQRYTGTGQYRYRYRDWYTIL